LFASGSAAGLPPRTVSGQPQFESSTLQNGIRVVTAQRPDAEAVAITLAFRGGARFEDQSTESAAHFLDRMYLQGTVERPSRDAIMRTVTSRGGSMSVGTGWEFLDFSIQMAYEDFDLAVDLLADLLKNSTFDAQRLEHQRGLILRELAERQDNPTSRAFDLFFLTVFRQHQLRFLPSGSQRGAESLTREALLAYRDARIVPANLVVGVVSPFSHQETVERFAQRFADWSAPGNPSVAGEPPPDPSPVEVQMAAGRNQATVIVGGPTPGLTHADRYPLWLLQTILGPGGGRLFYDIRDVHGLAYDTSMRVTLTAEAGSVLAYAGTDPANVDQVLELLESHLARVREELVSEQELEDAIGYLVGGTVVSLEESSSQAGQLAHNTSLGLPLSTSELEAGLRTVTREDVRRVASTYLAPERLTRVIVKPAE
jgi:predicted Zn-dependent peptidase